LTIVALVVVVGVVMGIWLSKSNEKPVEVTVNQAVVVAPEAKGSVAPIPSKTGDLGIPLNPNNDPDAPAKEILGNISSATASNLEHAIATWAGAQNDMRRHAWRATVLGLSPERDLKSKINSARLVAELAKKRDIPDLMPADKDVVPLLLKALEAGDKDLAREALSALGCIQATTASLNTAAQAVPYILKLLETREPEIVRETLSVIPLFFSYTKDKQLVMGTLDIWSRFKDNKQIADTCLFTINTLTEVFLMEAEGKANPDKTRVAVSSAAKGKAADLRKKCGDDPAKWIEWWKGAP